MSVHSFAVHVSCIFHAIDAVHQDHNSSDVYQAGLPSCLQCHHLGKTGLLTAQCESTIVCTKARERESKRESERERERGRERDSVLSLGFL